jgi:hypothetical protein
VFSRADLSRNLTVAVALFWTAISTAAVAREFRAAAGLNRTRVE